MADLEDIYEGGKYDMDSAFDAAYGIPENYGKSFLGFDYRMPASQIGVTTDPFTSNQLQKVSEKVSTGAKHIEVSAIQLKTMDAIPKQQFAEMNRLRKLVGVDLTLHAPIIEPTGVTKQGWNESDRLNAERQMTSVLRRSHEMDPKGNLVVTFHSSAGLPEPETRIINEKGEEELKEFWVANEDTGQFSNISAEVNYFKKEQKLDTKTLIKKRNEDTWYRELQSVNFNASQGASIIEKAMSEVVDGKYTLMPKEKQEALLEAYRKVVKGEKEIKEIEELKPALEPRINELTHGDVYLRSIYGEFQNMFNRAYKAAEMYDLKEDKNKLDKFRDEVAGKVKEMEEDPSKVGLLADELIKGVNVLRSITPPQTIKPLREWAIEKASTTFANVAFDAYNKFKDSAPIISIENPPVGMGLSRAEDLRDLVRKSRDKFVDIAKDKLNLSKAEAEEQAEKLIGVTWDVGHINMLRGHGYEEKHLIAQTKTVAPFVKHVHLSDNFGLEHTELPMGMGNVPTKKMLDLIHGYNDKVKKIAETGDWFSRQGGLGMTGTPHRQTLEAVGSPVFGGEMPYWNQIAATSGQYSVGMGEISPQIHHSMYGAGFSNLPVELGGQMGGRSRVSGAPIE